MSMPPSVAPAPLDPLQRIGQRAAIAGKRFEARDHEQRLRYTDLADGRVRVD
ncbi:hypothetical protein GGD41_003332 [Paraburkholderia bryophila]|uniref:Uncharacterized protein n=1 Tax=Paraburkholderia bryophila TaxID=420952 RepID=A0A7Y9W8E6_9BURK|nr:hypothetical protein [Paraburkholderia bryophila]